MAAGKEAVRADADRSAGGSPAIAFLIGSVLSFLPGPAPGADDISPSYHQFSVSRYAEAGVSERITPEYTGQFGLAPSLSLRLDGALSPAERVEPFLIGAELSYALVDGRSSLNLGVQPKWSFLRPPFIMMCNSKYLQGT